MTNNGYPTIIIVGGDAAINDAINGIMHTDSPHPALGIIPDGFGNDFAHYFSFEESNYRTYDRRTFQTSYAQDRCGLLPTYNT